MTTPTASQQLQQEGFATISQLYQQYEIAALLQCIEDAPAASPNFRRSQDVFAIRNLLGEIPALWPLLDTAALRALLGELYSSRSELRVENMKVAG